MLLELLQFVFMKWFDCAKKLPGLVLCNLQFLPCPKNNTLKKFHAQDYAIRHPALYA
jgi:hypothetical protein